MTLWFYNGRQPSEKRLEESFPGKGKALRKLLIGEVKPGEYEAVKARVGECYNMLSFIERLMLAINEVLEGHGVEYIWGKESEAWPIAYYANMGDTYIPTILYVADTNSVRITSMGDWVEANERKVRA